MRYLIYDKEKKLFTESEERPEPKDKDDYFISVIGTDLMVSKNDYCNFLASVLKVMWETHDEEKEEIKVRILGKDLRDWRYVGNSFDMGFGIRKNIEENVTFNKELYSKFFKEKNYERLVSTVCHSDNCVASIRYMVEILELFVKLHIATQEEMDCFIKHVEPYFKFNIAYEDFASRLEPLFKGFMTLQGCSSTHIMKRLASDVREWEYEINHKDEKE